MHDKNEIYLKVEAIFVELFEIDKASITPESKLYEDLDLDSIDAIDLVVRMEKETGKKIDAESLRQIRTVSDVVDAIATLIEA